MHASNGLQGRRFPHLSLALCLLALVTACQADTQLPFVFASQGRPIINGVPDTSAAHMAVVALVPPANSGYVGMHCTGTLITPTVVVTAAHCLEGYSVGEFDIFFGNNVWQPSTGTYRAVSEMQKHPSYAGTQNPVADIALVRLASAAPTTVTPIPFLSASLGLTSADEGGAVVFSGFGRTEDYTSGEKMTVTSTIGKVCLGPSGCNYGGAWVVAGAMGYPQTPGGPCSGDSGGPAFVTRSGQEYVAGVTSYGDETCSQYGVSTMTQTFESWILGFTGGTTAEICGNAQDDDGDGLTDCADPDCANATSCLVPDACAAAGTLTCGGQVSGTTLGGPTAFTSNSCLSNPEQGPERAYEVAAAAGTIATATLTLGGSGDLDLFLFPATSAGCNPQGCLASSMNEGSATETLQFTVPAGGAYLVVETWSTASAYTLQLACQGTQLENCVNALDDDGDGAIDCADSDCAATAACESGAENCTNGLDDDGDGAIDCADSNCAASAACAPGVEQCANGLDDDGDGARDCGDPDCASAANCQVSPPGPEPTAGGCSCDQDPGDGALPVAVSLVFFGLAWIRRRSLIGCLHRPHPARLSPTRTRP